MKKEHLEKVINLKETIEYQDNSIVSKVFLSKNQASVTLFAFDKGEIIDTHIAPMDAIVNILEGEAEIVIADEAFSLKTGEMIIMPANIPHSLKAVDKFKMLLVKA